MYSPIGLKKPLHYRYGESKHESTTRTCFDNQRKDEGAISSGIVHYIDHKQAHRRDVQCYKPKTYNTVRILPSHKETAVSHKRWDSQVREINFYVLRKESSQKNVEHKRRNNHLLNGTTNNQTSELNEANNKIKLLENQLKTLKSKITQSNTETYCTSRSNAVSLLENEKLKEDIEHFSISSEEQSTIYTSLQMRLKSKEDKLKKLQMNSLKKDETISKLSTMVKTHDHHVEQYKVELTNKVKSMAVTQQKMEILKQNSMESIAIKVEEINKSKTQIDMQKNEISSLSSNLTNNKCLTSNMEAQLKELQQEIKEQHNEKMLLKSHIEELKVQSMLYKKENDDEKLVLQDKVDALKQILDLNVKDIKVKDHILSSFKENIEDLKNQLQERKMENSSLQNLISKQDEENEDKDVLVNEYGETFMSLQEDLEASDCSFLDMMQTCNEKVQMEEDYVKVEQANKKELLQKDKQIEELSKLVQEMKDQHDSKIQAFDQEVQEKVTTVESLKRQVEQKD